MKVVNDTSDETCNRLDMSCSAEENSAHKLLKVPKVQHYKLPIFPLLKGNTRYFHITLV